MSNRQRGTIVTVLDQDILVRYANEHFTDDTNLKFRPGFARQMLLLTEDGPAVINTEGLGYVLAGDAVAVILEYGMSLTDVDVPLDLIEAAKTDEHIDLADGIRIFGDRLDQNHDLWCARAQSDTQSAVTS